MVYMVPRKGFEPSLTPLHFYALEERCGTGVYCPLYDGPYV